MEQEQARAISDHAAVRILREANDEHRRRDPDVDLRIDQYRVEARERPTEDGPQYEFLYEHADPSVPFILWTGHPMHFVVRVGPREEQVEVIPGE